MIAIAFIFHNVVAHMLLLVWHQKWHLACNSIAQKVFKNLSKVPVFGRLLTHQGKENGHVLCHTDFNNDCIDNVIVVSVTDVVFLR